MSDGWVKIYRSALKSSVFKNSETWMVWCWCLMKATYEPIKFPFNGEDLELKPGQFITGRIKATQELHMSASKWRTAINYLKSTSRLTIKTTNKFSLITVLNWAEYQDNDQVNDQQNDQPIANKSPTNRHIQEYKNIKKLKNNTSPPVGGVAEEPFVFLEKRQAMYKSKDRRMPIIAYYWEIKEFNFPSKKAYEAGLRRELDAAALLVGYTNDQIKKATLWLSKNADFKWTLETVHKYIDEPLENMKKGGKDKTEDDEIEELRKKYAPPKNSTQ